jgi:GrpB-like predicted nucleotidyltransferase (UPF0157 family)
VNAGDGLERHPSLDDRFDPAVRIVEYDPAWPALAAAELRSIEDAVGKPAPRLEHVGSTAVPGLAAKPILDPQLSVQQLEPRARYAGPLEALGYLFVPASESPDHHFFARPPERPRTHHLHVCEGGSEHEFRHVAMRDNLCARRDEAARYEALKPLAPPSTGPARVHRGQGGVRRSARGARGRVGSRRRLRRDPARFALGRGGGSISCMGWGRGFCSSWRMDPGGDRRLFGRCNRDHATLS